MQSQGLCCTQPAGVGAANRMRSTGGLSDAGAQHGKRDELKTDAEYMVAVAVYRRAG